MIHEFLFDPDAIIELVQKPASRRILKALNNGKPRIYGELFSYAELVSKLLTKTSGLDQNSIKRLEAWLLGIKDRRIKRSRRKKPPRYIKETSFPENSQIEHQRDPYEAIVTSGEQPAPFVHPDILLDDEADHPFWDYPQNCTVKRDPSLIAEKLSPFLRGAQEIIIVDRFFDPANPRWRASFKIYFQEIFRKRLTSAPRRVEVLTCLSGVDDWDDAAADFEKNCRNFFPDLIPEGFSVTFKFLRPGGRSDTHARYLVTELGACNVEAGFDKPEKNTGTTLISISEPEDFELRWRLYGQEHILDYYAEIKPCEVIGTGQL